MSDSSNRIADQRLVEQCQAREPAAWYQLQHRLLECARHVLPEALGPDAVNKALVDEITENVLSDLSLSGQLLAACHDCDRGLEHFLDYLLRRAVNHHYQKRARERRHEVFMAEAKVPELEVRSLPPGFEQELAQHLSPNEGKYLEWKQWPIAEGAPPCPFSACNARQLEHRIMKKALALLFPEGRNRPSGPEKRKKK